MKPKNFFLYVMLLLAASFALPSAVRAGTKVNPENCKAVGSAVVYCYECGVDNPRYLGRVSVLTGYEVRQGVKLCVETSEAKSKCAEAFGVKEGNVGYYAEYELGVDSQTEIYGTSCVEEVGRR
jgi:hypothetical protein